MPSLRERALARQQKEIRESLLTPQASQSKNLPRMSELLMLKVHPKMNELPRVVGPTFNESPSRTHVRMDVDSSV